VPVLSWLQAQLELPNRISGQQLLALLRDQHPALLELLDARAIAWWDRHCSRPQPSMTLLKLGAVFTVLSMLFISRLPAGERWSLPASTALFWIAVVLWKLLLLDWPRVLLQRRWPVAMPLLLRIGWLPLAGGSVLLATWPAAGALPMLLALSALQWMLVAVRLDAVGQFLRLNLTTLLTELGPVVLLAVWWVVLTAPFPDAQFAQLLLPAMLLLLTLALGSWEAQAAWVFDLTSLQRKALLCLLLAWCMGAAAAFWWLWPREAFKPLCAALLLIPLCLQRPIHLTPGQMSALRVLPCVAFAASVVLVLHPAIRDRFDGLGVFSLQLLCIVVVTGILAWRNETAEVLARLARGH
jgi:hypothetical protein